MGEAGGSPAQPHAGYVATLWVKPTHWADGSPWISQGWYNLGRETERCGSSREEGMVPGGRAKPGMAKPTTRTARESAWETFKSSTTAPIQKEKML